MNELRELIRDLSVYGLEPTNDDRINCPEGFAGCSPRLWDGIERRKTERAPMTVAEARQRLADELRAIAERARQAEADYWQGVEDDSARDHQATEIRDREESNS